ncbi:MAG: hypothetical protein LIO81_02350 [Clostridiales bacterium]|nr:hypothetical protein [Clostridiales bacterium]
MLGFEKPFLTADDIATDLSIGEAEAAELLRRLQREMERRGCFIVPGKISRAWYEQRKESGFIGAGEWVPLPERRLLSIPDFRIYAGNIGDGTARKLAKDIGADIHIGDRFLVDRVRFDEWCSRQERRGAGQEAPD